MLGVINLSVFMLSVIAQGRSLHLDFNSIRGLAPNLLENIALGLM